jgi:hypothetical protein
MSPRPVIRALAAGSVLFAAACVEQNEPAAPTAPTADAVVPADPQQPLAGPNALARGVPGFGGFFYDAAGRPTMYLTAASHRTDAERALSPYLRSAGIAAGGVQVRAGRFTWAELERLQTAVSAEALRLPGAVYVDADEAANRVTIGVERGAGAAVRGALTRLRLPAGAAEVVETDPVTFAVAVAGPTLQQRVRPLEGGIQINFPGFLCTLGFSANDGTQRGFITNSHCTNVQGGVDKTPYWQPLESVDNVKIATEVEDPTYRAIAGCPAGRVCRRADASRARYNVAASQVAFGKIAKTARPAAPRAGPRARWPPPASPPT